MKNMAFVPFCSPCPCKRRPILSAAWELCQKGAFAALTEFAVLSKIAGVGIERIFVQGKMSGRGVCSPCCSEKSGASGSGDVMQREARRVLWWWRIATAGCHRVVERRQDKGYPVLCWDVPFWRHLMVGGAGGCGELCDDVCRVFRWNCLTWRRRVLRATVQKGQCVDWVLWEWAL